MGTPNSEDTNVVSQPRHGDVPTDTELRNSHKDVEILNELLQKIIRPRLSHLSGFSPMGSNHDRDSEDLELWMRAIDLMTWDFRRINAVRITKPAIEVQGKHRSFGVILFLTREGEFITAYRQELERTAGKPHEHIRYLVTGFEEHRGVASLINWWDARRRCFEIPVINTSGESFEMQVFRALVGFLDAVVVKRMEAYHHAQHAQNSAQLLLTKTGP